MMIIVGDALLAMAMESTSCWPKPSPSSLR